LQAVGCRLGAGDLELPLGVAKCLARSLFEQSTVLTGHVNAGADAAS
jgi:hypothetical protein